MPTRILTLSLLVDLLEQLLDMSVYNNNFIGEQNAQGKKVCSSTSRHPHSPVHSFFLLHART